jgi:hypothetical protein
VAIKNLRMVGISEGVGQELWTNRPTRPARSCAKLEAGFAASQYLLAIIALPNGALLEISFKLGVLRKKICGRLASSAPASFEREKSRSGDKRA